MINIAWIIEWDGLFCSSLMEIRAFYEPREQEMWRRSWNTFVNQLISIPVMLYVILLLFFVCHRRLISSGALEWIKCTTFGVKVCPRTRTLWSLNILIIKGGSCKYCSRASFTWCQCQCGNEGCFEMKKTNDNPLINSFHLFPERQYSSSYCIIGWSRRSC